MGEIDLIRAYHGAMHGAPPVIHGGIANGAGLLDTIASYALIGLGSVAAAAFSFVTWRGAGKEHAKSIPIP